MLSEEDARRQLEEIRRKDWPVKILPRVLLLPHKARSVGMHLLRDRDARRKSWRDEEKKTQSCALALDAMPYEKRMKLFAALFPTWGHFVERAWQDQKSAPYPTGWAGKPFRAPDNHDYTVLQRYEWLRLLVEELGGFEEDAEWLAAWAPYLSRWYTTWGTGRLLAAVLDYESMSRKRVFDVLCESAAGEHEIGTMGRHVVGAMLCSSQQEAWEFCGRMLLAAQREEGLRQAILEGVGLAHPGAFRYMLGVILENDLGRFSATVRALDVWLGYGWDSAAVKEVNGTLEKLVKLCDDEEYRRSSFGSDGAETAYLALWMTAFLNVADVMEPATSMLSSESVKHRFVATHLLGQLQIPETVEPLATALADEDLRVVARAVEPFQYARDEFDVSDRYFDTLEKVIERYPAKKKLSNPIVWPWMAVAIDRQVATAALERNLGERDPSRLIPFLQVMSPMSREKVAERLAKIKKWDGQTRETLLNLLGDASPSVREKAIAAIGGRKLAAAEAPRLEKMLTRKVSDLRRGIVGLLMGLKDKEVLASATRLLESGDELQRLAGLELLRLMVESRRSVKVCQAKADEYKAASEDVSNQESGQLAAVCGGGEKVATLDDALGLMDPSKRTKPATPCKRKMEFFTKTTFELLKSLDDLVHENRNVSVSVELYDNREEKLLGDFRYDFGWVSDADPDTDLSSIPLGEVWSAWLEQRKAELGDSVGLELVRLFAMTRTSLDNFYGSPNEPLENRVVDAVAKKLGPVYAKYPTVVGQLSEWLVFAQPSPGCAAFLVDGLDALLSRIPNRKLRVKRDDVYDEDYWRGDSEPSQQWLNVCRHHKRFALRDWPDHDHGRMFGLLRWIDEPLEDLERERPEFDEVWAGYVAGVATEHDLFDQLLGPRKPTKYSVPRWEFEDLHDLSGRKPAGLAKKHPYIVELVDRCRRRILDVELARGETPTAATRPAMALRWAGEMDVLVRLLVAMGKDSFIRGWSYDSLSKAAVFSHLIRVTSPGEADTAEKFAEQIAECKLKEKRLLELAVYAPQWVDHVEHALEWPGLAEAVWWVHAHTKDEHWSVEDDIREQWASAVSQRTPLVAEDLTCGAVDVGWFVKVQSTLGADRWAKLDKVAKLASSGAGHKRAQLFADAMLAKVAKKDLLTRMADKRHQDSVRALGLLPLAEGDGRKKDLLERYGVLQEFLRGSRKFGSQRQASEKRAMEIGLHNLARTAGYPDPLRFQWAMEKEEVADLAAGAVTVTADEVEVSLAIDDSGQPELTVIKKGKKLKSIPAKLRKNEEIAELRERKTQIKRQASRSRLALEEAMCRGDAFTAAEIRELSTHPVLSPMISRLVFSGDGVLGYPVDEGQGLCDHAGKIEPIKKKEMLRIAHPYDLFETGEWHLWQRDCFRRELIQPFKQVFRELYVITDAEKEEGNKSRRYAGQQVHPRQAMALLGRRGWVASYDDGVHRTFHDQNVTAYIGILGDVTTPAEVEGVTVETVFFRERGKWKELPIAEIDPRVLSETMRDVDLVVSVAHRGGVDPEATASTRQMRGALIRETCALLEIDNVQLQDGHALIDGKLSEYSVHLGSGVVHRRPGGMLCIVPVHAQHRGRLFLPFADDDPKTAEIMSKVLMLARDSEIRDPTILEQLRG